MSHHQSDLDEETLAGRMSKTSEQNQLMKNGAWEGGGGGGGNTGGGGGGHEKTGGQKWWGEG